MRAIFVFWTHPMNSKDLKGYNKQRNPKNKIQLHDFEQEVQKYSAVSAKKYIGETTLYTDSNGYRYLDSIGLLEYYDNVDIDLLNDFNNNINFNSGYFWTTGKTYAICKQTEPFVFLDLDFVIKEKLPADFSKYDLVHNQWELQRGKFYLSESKLNDIDLPYWYRGMLMPNTSFLQINNLDLLKDYWYLHSHLLQKYGYSEVDESIWLLADQGILSFVIRKMKLNVCTLEHPTYIEDGEFEEKDMLKYGAVSQYVPIAKSDSRLIDYYHMWLDKRWFINDIEAKNIFLEKVKRDIKNVSKNETLL